MTFVEACNSFFKCYDQLPCKITLLLEGEEECGSPSLIPFLKKYKKDLKADYALICDTGMWDKNTPSISTRLRGMMGEEISIIGPNKDLHSGMYGGPAINPLKVLADILSSLHDKNGKVTIPHFYDNVKKIDIETLKNWESLNFSEKKFLNNVGLNSSSGEIEFSTLEKLWTRPTCELNGMWGGYIEEGFKTVIPSVANAKISFRLVDGQDPEKIRINFRNYIKKNLHPDCKVKFISTEGNKSINTPTESLIIKETISALIDEWGKQPVLAGCGGSIPIATYFKEVLNLNSLLVGFALETDNELENAKIKLKEKNLNAIVLNSLNDKGAGFSSNTNKITYIKMNHSVKKFPLQSKLECAKSIFEQILS